MKSAEVSLNFAARIGLFKPLLTLLALALIALTSLLVVGVAGDVSAQSAPTATPTSTTTPKPTVTPTAGASPDAIATAVAATVAALQPPTQTPDMIATAIAATVAVLQASAASPSPTPTDTPNAVATIIEAASGSAFPLGEPIAGRKQADINDLYLVNGTEGDVIYAAMTSEVFDAYLVLLDEDGSELATDDSSGGSGSAFLVHRLPWSGVFTVVARGYYADAAGRYTLTVDTFNNRVRTLNFGDEVRGDKEGIIPDLYAFEGQEGDWIYVAMETDAFDAFLTLWDEDWNELARDDSSGGNGNAFIRYTLPWDGRFTVIARGYLNDQVGRYRLFFDSRSHRAVMLTGGEEITAERTSPIPALYFYEGREGQTITVSMDSAAFDTYLVLVDEYNNVLREDDDSGEGTNARLQYTLPADGLYTIIARSYNAAARGIFTLRFNVSG